MRGKNNKPSLIASARTELLAQHQQTPGGLRRFNSSAARLALAAVRQRRAAENDTRWIILTCHGPSTLRLARSLVAAGVEAWTPIGGTEKKRPRSRAKIEIELAIIPGVVFARHRHLDELAYVRRLPVSPHPPFTIVSGERGVPLIRDSSFAPLRQEEERQRVETAERVRLRAELAEQDERAQQRRERLAIRRKFAVGQRVTIDSEACLVGAVGVIEASDGRKARVSFGGLLTVNVEAWQVYPV